MFPNRTDNIKLTPFDDKWIAYRTTNKSLIKLITFGIELDYRKYDADEKCFLLHWSRLPIFMSFANKLSLYVDRTHLPDKWQMLAAGGAATFITSYSNENHFSTLFLSEDAPLEVIKAAYEALMHLYHPDTNDGEGNTEQLQKVRTAYKQIMKFKKL